MYSFIERYAFIILLFVAVTFFCLYPGTSETFPSQANMKALITGNVVVAIIAIAALIPLVCEEFDLSVGAVAGLSSIFVADHLSGGGSLFVAVFIGISFGLIIGALNAFLITVVGVNAVITTLGTSIIIAGIISQLTGGRSITGNIPREFIMFGTGTTYGVPNLCFALILIGAVVWYLLEHTPFGRQLYAYGSNRSAAVLVGIRTKFVLSTSFLLAGGLAGFAGILQVARAGGADPRVGDSFTMPALAAAFLSAAVLQPGRYNVIGTIIAIYFLATLNSGLNLAGAKPFVNNYVNGFALILGVALAVVFSKRK
jgi:ribose transport system permease protein